MNWQIILIVAVYALKRTGIIITKWTSTLILTYFGRLFTAFVNTHTLREKQAKELTSNW